MSQTDTSKTKAPHQIRNSSEKGSPERITGHRRMSSKSHWASSVGICSTVQLARAAPSAGIWLAGWGLGRFGCSRTARTLRGQAETTSGEAWRPDIAIRQLDRETIGKKRQRSRRQRHPCVPPFGTANCGNERKQGRQQGCTQDDLVFVLWPRKTVYEMVGLWRIEQRKPEHHNQQHSDRSEQVGEWASHAENIRLGEMTWRLNNRTNQYLFWGPPGNGKSATIRVMAAHPHIQPYTLDLSDTEEKSASVLLLFEKAATNAPALVIIEDLDRAFPTEGKRTRERHVSFQTLLNCLDGVASRDGVLVVATANDPTCLDPAILKRPGRFDRVVQFRNPDAHLRREYYQATQPRAHGRAV